MNEIPEIQKIISIEPFKITCLWSTDEIRVSDFEPEFEKWKIQGDKRYFPLMEYDNFEQVTVSEEGTLEWTTILISFQFAGKSRTAPLDLDPVVLYENSQIVEVMSGFFE